MSVRFEDNSIQVIDAMDTAITAWLYEAAGEIEAQTKRNCNSDSGQTKNSFKHKVDTSNQVAYVGSDLQNAIWEEFGTGEHAINNDGRNTPWYIPVEWVTGSKKPTFQGKVVIVHGKNGQEFYKTDGKKANRPLYKAFISKESKCKKRLQALLKEGLK